MVQRDSAPVESRAGHPVARAELRPGADPAAGLGLSAEAWRSALVLSLAGAAALTQPRARAPTPVMLDGAETKDAAARRLRAIVLGLLVFENSLTALCAKASRVPHPGQVMYAGSVAVLLSELLKITSCFGLIAP